MSEQSGEGVGRRGFLGGVALAASAGAVSTELFRPAAPARAAETVPKGERGYTPKLAAYAAQLKFQDIPQNVRQRIKDCITDTVAVILYGGKLPWSQMVIAHAHRTGAGGKSHILGTGGMTEYAPSAALALIRQDCP